MSGDLHYRSAGELARMIRAREVSAREVVAAHIERIEEVNPALNAVVQITADQALSCLLIVVASTV